MEASIRESSILKTIKPMLNVEVDDKAFDTSIISAINGALFNICQLGYGPVTGYRIHGYLEQWTDLKIDEGNYEAIVNYIYYKSQLDFDPPPNSFLVQILKDNIKELEWRLEVAFNPSKPIGGII